MNSLSPIWYAFTRLKPHAPVGWRKRLLVVSLLMIAVGALASAPPLIVGRIVDSLSERAGPVPSRIGVLLGCLMASVLLRECLQAARKFLVEDTATRMEKSIRMAVSGHLLRLPLQYYRHHLVGELQGRLNRGIEGATKLVKLAFLDLLPAAAVAAAALITVFAGNPAIALAMILVIPVSLVIVHRQVASQRGLREALRTRKEEIDGKVVELLGGLETVRAMHTENFETERIEVVAEDLRRTEIRHHRWMAFYDAAKSVNEGAFLAAVIGLVVWLVLRGHASVGQVLAATMLFQRILEPLREVHRVYDEASEACVNAEGLLEIQDEPADDSYATQPSSWTCGNACPAIELDKVDFSYRKAGTEVMALKGASVRVREGEFVGICGPTAAGKSTMLKLLLRLNAPSRGRIVIRGQNLADIDRSTLAEAVGYVPQTPFLFSGTIADNITYGIPSVPMERVIAAATRAQLHHEIEALEEGYQTQVSERGANLSGGQRQRIAVARVFLRDPDILLLDEAMSALDNISESSVQKAIEELMNGRTVISVAHRLSSLRNADRILVVQDGEIVQEGRFVDLESREGLFAELLSHGSGSPRSSRSPQERAA
ncbi:MAG: ABC transporter ATP-binding protein [Lentisphaerae bacterium]|jgi:ATP-binding cassette, subfamily B, bacterial|nr:ABC transporter ATP-binding protein [Lentisphaerota bacterium]MBT4817273.1 ABC transporter ATP-binding protein [Lentisphaerota bacterium]MBT5608080.1 ABC transporter ATP-binding protein [Lentisphaerota bacterium]MBT7057600.1 ABC transporter ATP-binding protein [Lentisphaerota bacterium]MBT7840227.1 ABC transporter ATP-binding protein [Lentisphaerota bacterium]